MPSRSPLETGRSRRSAASPSSRRWGLALALALAGAVFAIGFGYPAWWGRAAPAAPSPAAAGERESAPSVKVVHPRRGGIRRTTVQPGSVHAFESVDLLAMVSGYLKIQVADIGYHMKKGEVLAEIDTPREARAVEEAAARLEQARAQRAQVEARIKTMEGERDAAAAAVRQAESDIDRLVAAHELVGKEFARFRELAGRNAVEKRLVDEKQQDLDSVAAAERTARLAVDTAAARARAAGAKVDQARADAVEARAAVAAAAAHLARARVDRDYSRIQAPFDGVVTHRSFHPGAFIRAASEGGQPPLLTVTRTDLMRVVVQVPDRDVVATDVGDSAVVAVDALGGQTFPGTVARIAEFEDPVTRTMRVEIDLPNPKGMLREGMYGRATITLEPVSSRLAIPPACVIERSGQARGVVYVVHDGLARRTEVELGADDGSVVEVLTALKPDDAVVIPSGLPLEDGMRVVVPLAAAGG